MYFAAFSKHVGVYIMGRSKERFAKELEPYRTSPSTLQLPLGSRVPVTLLKKLIRARVEENLAGMPRPKRNSRSGRPAASHTRVKAKL